MSQAKRIITKMGGARNVANLLNVAHTTVYKWDHDKGKNGTGGVIPLKYWLPLIEASKGTKSELTLEDFEITLEDLQG